MLNLAVYETLCVLHYFQRVPDLKVLKYNNSRTVVLLKIVTPLVCIDIKRKHLINYHLICTQKIV